MAQVVSNDQYTITQGNTWNGQLYFHLQPRVCPDCANQMLPVERCLLLECACSHWLKLLRLGLQQEVRLQVRQWIVDWSTSFHLEADRKAVPHLLCYLIFLPHGGVRLEARVSLVTGAWCS